MSSGSNVVFQCRVFSKDLPSIKWFKKVDRLPNRSGPADTRHIQHLNNTYALLESTGDMRLSGDIYLSKLILSNVALKDTGCYVCVALNTHGYEKQEAHLTIDGPDWWNTKARRGGLGATIWLFLIPTVFIMLPILIWMCFWVHKNECSKREKALAQIQMQVTKTAQKRRPRRVRYQKKAEPNITSPYMIVNVEIV